MISRSSENIQTESQDESSSHDDDAIVRIRRLESAMEDEGVAVWQL